MQIPAASTTHQKRASDTRETPAVALSPPARGQSRSSHCNIDSAHAYRQAKARRSGLGLLGVFALVALVCAAELLGLPGSTASMNLAASSVPVGESGPQAGPTRLAHSKMQQRGQAEGFRLTGATEPVADHLLDELEKAYWACDLEAATSVQEERRVDESVMHVCGGISRELQRVKFDDDFGRLHQWTVANRDTRNAPPGALSRLD